MTVTVLMAVHNGGAYLQEAVASVLSQTFSDLELLIIDDASTDHAIDDLPRDSRLRVLRNDRNIGQVPSLNRGLSEARTAYVARLDADDLMLPTRLERQVAVLDEHPAVALVGTWMDVVDERGRILAPLRGRIDSYAGFVSAILSDRIPFGHPSLMYRRDVVLRLGGYDPSLAPAEDKDLYRRLALQRYEARVVPEPLVRYRRHEAQLSQVQVAKQLANDYAGQERFLSALDPDTPARTLRLLLAHDAAYWTETPLADLEPVLTAMTERLQLTPVERDAVARTIARRCALTLLHGWSSRSPDYSVRAFPAAAFVAAHGDTRLRLSLGLQPPIRATRPIGVIVGATRTRTRQALRSPVLEPPRRLLRRSRLLRRLYAKLLGFRLLDG